MDIQASWLLRGYFDFSKQDPHDRTSRRIRNELCVALGLPKDKLRIANYPVGPAWRHTLWWREGESDYAEAQYFLQIARAYPVLSLGVSVEKGIEASDLPTAVAEKQDMDRSSWDWQRLGSAPEAVLENDVPAVASKLHQPVTVRFKVTRQRQVLEDESRTFSFVEGDWFERYRGAAQATEIAAYLVALDQRRDLWVVAHFAVDLSPRAADGLSAAKVAQLLSRFEPIRRRLRGYA